MAVTVKLIIAFFADSAGTPQTGLSPTIRIWNVAAGSHSLDITDDPLTEVGDGFYKYNFTGYNHTNKFAMRIDGGAILGSSRYAISVNSSFHEDIAFSNWDETASDHVIVGTVGQLQNQTSIDAETVLKFERNRTRIDKTAKTLTIFDDDGTTPIRVFDLIDSTGTPSIEEIAERKPQ